jgi:hypothetical protein
MVRFVFIAALLVVGWLVLSAVWRRLKAADPDWNGIAFMVGFVALAFYLRHVTGLVDGLAALLPLTQAG